MDIAQTLALTLGVGWASGINLYAAVFTLGLLGALGHTELPPDLAILASPLVIGAAGLMYLVEFFADKTPGVDTVWDLTHTFIRIPAGVALAWGAASGMDISQPAELAAVIAGGGLAAGSHLTKTGTRAIINTSPEPVSNWTASVTEDIAVIGGLWTALNHPLWFLGALIVIVLIMAWALPRIWRALKGVFGRLRSLFRSSPKEPLPDERKPGQD